MLSPVEQIKERLSIFDVVSSYVKLHKAGKNYKGLSPFSNEKTPSFFVSPERDMYYCFSTSQGGDIFTFVEKMEGVDFSGALKILAEKAGVTLAQESQKTRDERERLYDMLRKADAFYRREMEKHPDAVRYLKARGVSEETMRRFHVGYAESEWRNLYNYLKRDGYGERELLDAGLIKKAEHKDGARHYDTFRGRIMFPIRDSAGRIVAFSGRIFPETPTKDGVVPAKYINSPETPLYNKSRILYGYDLAKGAIKKFNFSILVEGQMDVVLSHQTGYPNTVGVSGTALTREQLTLLNRLSKNIVMAFDADKAGIASAGRGASLALSMGMDVKVAALPSGIDPADMIKTDQKRWKEAIKSSTHIVEFALAQLRAAHYEDRKFKLEAEKTVLPFIADIKSAIDRAHFIQLVAREIGVSEDIILAEMNRITRARPEHNLSQSEEGNARISRRDSPEDKLFGIILWQESLKKPAIDVIPLKTALKSALGDKKTEELLKKAEGEKEQNIFKTELLYEEEWQLKEDVEDLLRHLMHRLTKEELEETTAALRKAETKKDGEMSSRLLVKSREIAEKLKLFIGK